MKAPAEVETIGNRFQSFHRLRLTSWFPNHPDRFPRAKNIVKSKKENPFKSYLSAHYIQFCQLHTAKKCTKWLLLIILWVVVGAAVPAAKNPCCSTRNDRMISQQQWSRNFKWRLHWTYCESFRILLVVSYILWTSISAGVKEIVEYLSELSHEQNIYAWLNVID